VSQRSALRLSWPGCRNVRDVGGLPTTGGGEVRVGALVRADSPHRLTSAGVEAVRGYGVRRVLDLRSVAEAAARPGPFAADPMYRLVPLIDPAREAERDTAAESTVALIYRASVVRNAERIVAGLAAIADAPPGGVLVHCASGKDRTGMIVALALRIAGVPDHAIADDYAFSGICLREEHERAMADAADPDERARLADVQSSDPDTILGMLARVDEAFRGVSGYLVDNGMTAKQLDRLRARLRTD